MFQREKFSFLSFFLLDLYNEKIYKKRYKYKIKK